MQRLGGLERAISIAAHNRVGAGQVDVTVAIEIGRHEIGGRKARGGGHARRYGGIPVPFEEERSVRGNQHVGQSVSVHVGDERLADTDIAHEPRCPRREPAGGLPGHDEQPVSAAGKPGHDHIGIDVAIEITDVHVSGELVPMVRGVKYVVSPCPRQT